MDIILMRSSNDQSVSTTHEIYVSFPGHEGVVEAMIDNERIPELDMVASRNETYCYFVGSDSSRRRRPSSLVMEGIWKQCSNKEKKGRKKGNIFFKAPVDKDDEVEIIATEKKDGTSVGEP